MKTPITRLLAICFFAALAPAVHAQQLVSYIDATPTSLGPTTVAADVTATALSGTCTPVVQGFNGVSQIAWTTVNTDASVSSSGTATGTFAGAVVANNYFQFTLTPAEGTELNLSSISFTVAAGTGNTTAVRSFYLTTATGSGSLTSADIATDSTQYAGGAIPYEASTVSSTVPESYTISLSSFAGITTSQTFRIYVQTQTISQSLIFGSLTVNGSVSAIPEPATTAAILSGAALGLLALRRRQKRDAV